MTRRRSTERHGGVQSRRVPDLSSIRRLTLADLKQPQLEDLVAHGEDLLVERKRDLPKPPRFGAAAASFANTLGGWILLGVDDTAGEVHGWEKPERLDLQSHLGSVLRAEVDPLPPFVCAMRKVDDKPIGVIRVFPSVDSPHIVRGTGAVYVRSSKGKEPVDDHRTLLELARRGEDAEARARDRLRSLPVVNHVLKPPDAGYTIASDDRDLRFIARAAPLTVTPALAEWPLTRHAWEWCKRFAESLLPPINVPYERRGPDPEPHGRAMVTRLAQWHHSEIRDAVAIVVDSGGVMGIELRRGAAPGDQRVLLLNAMLDEEIRPLVWKLAAMLYEAEAYGRAAVDLWINWPPKTAAREQEREGIPQAVHVAGELTIPADDTEADALAEAWHREIQREFGITKFEREPDD